jgi:hypothetical protein
LGVVSDGTFLNRFLALGVTASVTITVGSLIVLIVCIVAAVCCCKKLMCKPPPEGTTSAAPNAMPNNLGSNGAPSYNQSKEHKKGCGIWSQFIRNLETLILTE